jgi:hypothetical protein
VDCAYFNRDYHRRETAWYVDPYLMKPRPGRGCKARVGDARLENVDAIDWHAVNHAIVLDVWQAIGGVAGLELFVTPGHTA